MLVIILVIKQATTRSLYVTIALMPMRRLGQARWAGWVKHPVRKSTTLAWPGHGSIVPVGTIYGCAWAARSAGTGTA